LLPFARGSNRRRRKGQKKMSDRRVVRLVVFAVVLATGVIACSSTTRAQAIEVNGGYEHVSGDFGTNGFTVGTGVFLAPNIAIAANYDDTWNDSTVGVFQFSSIGPIGIRSHVQDFLVGPRFYFATRKIDHDKYTIRPFAEAQFGATHLYQAIDQLDVTNSGSDTSFAWTLGGGVDYALNSHWNARFNLDLLRTHFADAGQSRLRLGLQVAYNFGAR
jgi:hypothetical protein